MKTLDTLKKVLGLNSWVFGLIAATVFGLPLLAIGIFGFAVGYLSDPITGFLTTICGSVCFIPFTIGLIAVAVHSRAKVTLANLLGFDSPSAPSAEAPAPPPSN